MVKKGGRTKMDKKIMPFGKYKLYYFDEIPDDYLQYIVDEFDDGWVKDEAKKELKKREKG